MNGKYFGEIGQNVVIGEFAKYGIGMAVPLGDNLPFDLIAIVENKLYKLQIKSSSQGVENETVLFSFCSNDFYTGEIKRYSKQEVDFVIGVDLRSYQLYLFDEFEKQRGMTIRLSMPKNGQKRGFNWHEDFALNLAKIKEVFNFVPPDTSGWFSKRIAQAVQYDHTCQHCSKEFVSGGKNAKYCSAKCSQQNQRKVKRPSKDVLQTDIEKRSWKAMSRKYGVSDNAVRKWARSYGLI